MVTISFEQAAILLQQDMTVGVLPTDTVYGLVASAHDPRAVKRLYDLKGREGKPGTIIAASIDQLVRLGLKTRYLKSVIDYWPGALSIVIPCDESLSYLHEGVGSLAVRLPADEPLAALLEQTGPLLTTSANHPGEPVASDVQAAEAYFGDKLDFYVDGGNMSGRKPSTIIRVVDDAVEVLRQGAVKINDDGSKT